MNRIVTDELDEAAVARACGYALEQCRLNPRLNRIEFVFASENGDLKSLIRDHQNGNLKLCSLDLLASLKWARRLMHTARNNSGASHYNEAHLP